MFKQNSQSQSISGHLSLPIPIPPEKRKPLFFWGDAERDQWHEMGQSGDNLTKMYRNSEMQV